MIGDYWKCNENHLLPLPKTGGSAATQVTGE